MQHYNPNNERIKKAYFRFLKEADRKSDSTIDGIRKAISRYETYTEFRDFKTFGREQAIAFKAHLAKTKTERTGAPLAKATMHSTMNALQAFVRWLACQPGYKSKINVTDIEYLNLSEKEVRAAMAPKPKRVPTLEQIETVVRLMPIKTIIERRDRAVVAFTILTGIRDRAMTSLRLKHIDLEMCRVVQDPREVHTKFSKQIVTYFFPVGALFREVTVDWLRELREVLLYGHDDPVFPRTRVSQDHDYHFVCDGLEPAFWGSAAPVRKIFRDAFERAGLSYFNPHSFRDTLAQLGKAKCRSPEEFEAWSKNLGHEHMLTTFRSYGQIDPHRQGELIKALGSEREEEAKLDALVRMVGELKRVG